jgi:hypothetical protein
MNMSSVLSFQLIAFAAALLALAQPVYRCGATYSHVPCGADVKPAQITTGAAPDRPAGPTGWERALPKRRDG